jgi:LuxR family transcriptional regulator
LLDAADETQFLDVLSRTARQLGFDYCAFGMRIPLPVSKPKVVMLNNYSKKWQERYARENYLAIDPTVAHGMRSVMPLIWSDQVFANARAFWEEARGHGLVVGWAQSCHDSKGIGTLLSLARSHDDLVTSGLEDIALRLSWLVQAAHVSLSRILLPKLVPEAENGLTPREIEVLRWTADGKTSSEVGEIMCITERTVNFHVNNALVKLGVANKTAGVVKAAMLRLL